MTTLADIAHGADTAARGELMEAALRAGENRAGANAVAEEIAQQNERNLAAQEAKANIERIGSEADYNKSVLAATALPVGMEQNIADTRARLYGISLSGANQELSTAERAAEANKGFWDSFGGFVGGFIREGLELWLLEGQLHRKGIAHADR